MEKIEKVLAYIFRVNNNVKELLVFDHPGVPEVNPQVPAGTLKEGESPESGVLREVFEESGLRLNYTGNYLGVFEFKEIKKCQLHLRHVFEFTLQDTKSTWTHHVVSDDDDNGETFDYYWLPIEIAKQGLVSEMGEYL